MTPRTKILVVEDDPSIRILLEEELTFQGFDAQLASEGEEGYRLAQDWAPELIILDLMLPGTSGLEICQRLRGEGVQVPIILLTARDQETDKVLGLDAGANDYVTKPFGVAELMARIRAHLRERERVKAEGDGPVVIGDLKLNPRRMQLKRGDEEIELTRREFEILRMVLEARGGTVSREEFLELLWPETYVTPRTIDTHVSMLRRKIGPMENGEDYLLGVRGVGYRLNPLLLEESG